MKLVAIRHGETEWNRQLREIGQLDSPLTDIGIAQAAAIAERLGKASFDALYSSDLGRAIQTTQIIGAAIHLPIQIDAGLREHKMGIFEGLTLEEMIARFPAERARLESRDPDYVIPDGESARQRQERSVRTLTAIAERHANQSVVVVTHGGILAGFFQFVLGMNPGSDQHFKRVNCGYNEFAYAESKWRLETWNDTSHLGRMATP